jgi:pyruvyltransferase
MVIRTFYWKERVVSSLNLHFKKLYHKPEISSRYFSKGNAGDIFAKDVLALFYKNIKHKHIRSSGQRLLLIGSIAHTAQKGDFLCGVGIKEPSLIPKDRDLLIFGLRGPLSYDVLKKNDFNVSNVKFLLDPGLLMTPPIQDAEKSVIFIPHYRERFTFKHKLHKEIKFVDIDSEPLRLISKIQQAKLVYTSSLHGIIFSHALNVPCVYVKPQTNESEFKYKDYYASVNLHYPRPLNSIYDANFMIDTDTPATVNYSLSDFVFPSIEELKSYGITEK